MRRIFLCLVLTLPVPALAEMWEPEYKQCNEHNTLGIVDCVAALTQQWDKKLNASYKRLMQNSEAAQQTALKAAQRLWIKYRDANCNFYYAGPGTISTVAAAECLRSMTKERTCELQSAGFGEEQQEPACQRR